MPDLDEGAHLDRQDYKASIDDRVLSDSVERLSPVRWTWVGDRGTGDGWMGPRQRDQIDPEC